MFKKILLVMCVLLLAACGDDSKQTKESGSAQTPAAAKERVITVAHDATWPPMEFIDEDKNLVGYSVDYIDAIAKETGVKVEHRNVAWDGIFAGLVAGRYDVVASSVTITAERSESMDFSTPYYEVKQAVILPIADTAATTAELSGKTLGVQIGTTGQFAVERMKEHNVTARSYDDIGLAIQALNTGRVDGVVCDDPVAADYVLQRKEYTDKFKIAFIVEEDEKEFYGFAVKKGNKEILDIINQGVDKVKSKGIEAEIQKKWFSK